MMSEPAASLAPATTAVPSVPAANFRPGAVLALLLLCVYGGLAISVDFPRAALGYPERRSHLLHDGVQPRARWRPDLSPRGSDARVARISERTLGRLSEEGTRHHRLGVHASPAVCLDDDRPRSRSVALLLRQVLHLFGVRRAVCSTPRDQRVPRLPRRAAGAGRLVRLRFPPRADARGNGRDPDGGLSAGVGRAGVLRLDCS